MGMTAVLSDDREICGIFTDGDLRRAMQRLGDLRSTPVGAVMTKNPRTILPGRLAVEAVQLMEEHKINQLLVVDSAGRFSGALNMHGLVPRQGGVMRALAQARNLKLMAFDSTA